MLSAKGKAFLIRSKVNLHFGFNAISELHSYMKSCRRGIIITGKKGGKVSGALPQVEEILKKLNIDYLIYNNVTPNPTIDIVEEAASIAKDYRAEFVIGVGGGSSIDVAKAVAVRIVNEGNIWDYVKGYKIIENSLPIYAVGTTHGTGSEVNRYAVLTNPETKEKSGFASEFMYPKASFDDPRTTLTLPKLQTVSTSIDAFYHAIESSTTTLSSLYTKLLSKEAIRLITKYLPKVYVNPKDLESRYFLMYASVIAGISIDNGRTHIIHALEHPLSALKDVPHGIGLAVLGPVCIKYLWESIKETLSDLLQFLEPKISLHDSSSEVMRKLRLFQKEVGLPNTLSELGFGKDDVNMLVELAFKSGPHLFKIAPFKVSKEDVKKIYLELI